MIKCNIGELEKTVRALVALPIISWGYYYRHISEHWSQIIFWGGMYLAFTATFAWCPMHWMMATLRRLAKRSGGGVHQV